MKLVRTLLPPLVTVAVLAGIPFALLSYETKRTGLPRGEVLSRVFRQAGETKASEGSTAELEDAEVRFLVPHAIGRTTEGEKATIAHVAIYDLDQDGLLDVLVCDVLHRRVTWIRQAPLGTYTETPIGDEISGPAHVEACDMDGDGDLDVLVSAMGMILPNNDRIGSVVILENDGQQRFTTRVVASNIARVTDVQGADLDGDGDRDLAVGQFGYDQGEIRWMRNEGGWRFESRILLSLSGTIHTPITDLDGDGDLDIVALVSQEWEEVYAFENDGHGNFRPHLLYGVADDDYGSSGIGLADLDADGDQDILWANGDAFVATDYRPLPCHGMQWLENRGGFRFAFHRLGRFPGAYDPLAADLDGDGDLDVVSVSAFSDWNDTTARSLRWWEKRGDLFFGRDLAESPTHLLTVDAADMNADGRVDLVTGSMNLYPPFDRMGRITVWINEWPGGNAP